MQNGTARGQLQVCDWPESVDSSRRAGGYFALDSASMLAVQNVPAQVKQGYVEQTNARATDSAVRLVELGRQFESLQKAAQMAADMNRQSCEDVGRVA
jgi:flagellar basal body rod protein FlgG